MAHSTPDLPIHFRTGLRAVGIVNGRPVWPIMGGEESDDAAAQAAAAKAASDAAAAKAAADAAAANAGGDKGFPENTPLEQMKPEQREAYWKHHSRKHEDTVKAYGGITPEQAKQLKERAEKLEYDLGSENDKKVADAKKAAEDATRSQLLPEVISAKLDAAAARAGVSEEDLGKALKFADTKLLLGADGKPDAAKVTEFIATITPATGNSRRSGPSTHGHGNSSSTSSGNGHTKAASVAEVRAEREAARAAKK